MKDKQKNSYEKIPSVSAIIIRQNDDKTFIAQRSYDKKWSPGKWETIGGRTRKNESPEESLKREAREETKAEIKSFKYFNDYYSDNRQFKTYIVELVGEPKPNKKDFKIWGWFDKKEIEKMDFAINCKSRLIDYYDSIYKQ